MSKYWPRGIELSDTQSPLEILRNAQSEWESSSEGVLTLVLQKAESQSGNDMILVHAKHIPSNRTASLFSVVCRKGLPYPARLQPKDEELPNFFKKSYKTTSIAAIGAASVLRELNEEKRVKNEWVSDSPSEFRKKLAEVFNLGSTKSETLNLISSQGALNDDESEQPGEDEGAEKPESPSSEVDADSE